VAVVKLVVAHPTEPKHLVKTIDWDGDVDLEELSPLIEAGRTAIGVDVAVLRVYPPVDGTATVLVLPLDDLSCTEMRDWIDGEAAPASPQWSTKAFRGEITAWASRSLGQIQDLHQVRIWDLSWVARAECGERGAYIKATGHSPLFADEGVVSTTLARLFPDRVPAPIATDSARNWMILPDLGPSRRLDSDKPEYERFIRDFARMQIESAAHVDELLDGGFVDRRPEWTATTGREWLDAAALDTLPESDRARAAGILDQLPDHVARLSKGGLPNTLLHGDIHSGNTIGNGDGFWYIDWSDASVGHPFLDMFTIRLTEGARGDELKEAYLDEWRDAGYTGLDETWEAAGVVMAAHHAISYAALTSAIEPPVEPDLLEMIPQWLVRMIDAADGRPMRL
jgi:phosphotransferase family enzyme